MDGQLWQLGYEEEGTTINHSSTQETYNSRARVPAKRKACEPNSSKSDGLKVRPLWLHVSTSERYLLLEDTDTGDVLLPLIYMKSMFEANYSRKLSSLKHRLVNLPEKFTGERPRGFVYWQWAFESPHEVKVLVRKMLGEENTPQGHLRLILLPIVFNAMAQKAKLRESPFFKELEAAVRASAYWPLLKLPLLDHEEEGGKKVQPIASSHEGSGGSWPGRTQLEADSISKPIAALFSAPKREPSLELEVMTWREEERERQTSTLDLIGGTGTGGKSWLEESTVGSIGVGGISRERHRNRLFRGPHDLQKTIAKYCLTYDAVEGGDARKVNRTGVDLRAPPAVVQSEDAQAAFGLASTATSLLQSLKEQGEEMKSEMQRFRMESEQQMAMVATQLQSLRDCLMPLVANPVLDKRDSSQPVPPTQQQPMRSPNARSSQYPSVQLSLQQPTSSSDEEARNGGSKVWDAMRSLTTANQGVTAGSGASGGVTSGSLSWTGEGICPGSIAGMQGRLKRTTETSSSAHGSALAFEPNWNSSKMEKEHTGSAIANKLDLPLNQWSTGVQNQVMQLLEDTVLREQKDRQLQQIRQLLGHTFIHGNKP